MSTNTTTTDDNAPTFHPGDRVLYCPGDPDQPAADWYAGQVTSEPFRLGDEWCVSLDFMELAYATTKSDGPSRNPWQVRAAACTNLRHARRLSDDQKTAAFHAQRAAAFLAEANKAATIGDRNQARSDYRRALECLDDAREHLIRHMDHDT